MISSVVALQAAALSNSAECSPCGGDKGLPALLDPDRRGNRCRRPSALGGSIPQTGRMPTTPSQRIYFEALPLLIRCDRSTNPNFILGDGIREGRAQPATLKSPVPPRYPEESSFPAPGPLWT